MLEIKLKNTYKKLIHYFSIFTIILGTTFGSINSAYAADAIVDTAVTAYAAITEGGTTFTFDGAADDVLTITPAEAEVFTGVVTTAVTEKGSMTFVGTTEVAPFVTTFNSAVGTSAATLNVITIGTAAVGGAATFDSNVFVKTLNLVSGDHVAEVALGTFSGNLTTTAIVLNDLTDGVAKLVIAGTGTTVAGTIDAASTGEGILQITGASTTIDGEVGIGTTDLRSIDVDATTTFNSATEAVAYTVDADTTFTGAVLANTSFTVNTAGTDVILNTASDLSLATVTTGTLTSNGLLTTSDLINTAGKVYLEVKDNEMGAARYAAGNGAELHVGKAFVSGDTIYLSDDANGGATDFHSGSKIYLPTNLSSGETLKLVDAGAWDATDGNALTAAAAISVTLQDTALVDYTASAAIGDTDIIITATNRTATSVASQLGTTKNVGTAALQLMTAMDSNDTSGDTSAYTAFDNALKAQGGYSATEDTSFLQQSAPQDDMISGSTLASKAVTGTVQGIISNRMASLRSGDAYYGMGMSAGNMTAKSGFIQAFGSEVEQKNKTVGSGTQYGYESSSAGFALGFDGTTDTGVTVGLSFSMSNTDLDGKGTGKAKNDIDSYTASLYWDKTGQNGYVEGSLTYGLNENKTSRLVNTAGLSRTYTGSYDSNQVSLSLGGGAPNAVGASGYVTPFIGVTGTYIKTDAYTETSNTSGDNLRLRVAQDDINSLVGKVGVKYHNVTDKGTPMISLSLNNEFGDDTINSTNTYQGGGSSFTTSTDVEPLSATLGLGYSYGSDTASIEFAYEAEANDDKYLGHYGSIKIVGKF